MDGPTDSNSLNSLISSCSSAYNDVNAKMSTSYHRAYDPVTSHTGVYGGGDKHGAFSPLYAAKQPAFRGEKGDVYDAGKSGASVAGKHAGYSTVYDDKQAAVKSEGSAYVTSTDHVKQAAGRYTGLETKRYPTDKHSAGQHRVDIGDNYCKFMI